MQPEAAAILVQPAAAEWALPAQEPAAPAQPQLQAAALTKAAPLELPAAAALIKVALQEPVTALKVQAQAVNFRRQLLRFRSSF
jgi:hypothetical protein